MMSPDDSSARFGGLVRGVWGDFRHAFPQLLAYDVLFKILALALLTPLSAWLLSTLIAASGRLAVSNEDILAFAMSVAGLVTIVVMAAVGLVMTFAEEGGLFVIGAGVRSGRPRHSMEALRHVVRRMPVLLGLAFLKAGCYLLCLVPFAAVAGVAYAVLLTRHDVNFYLTTRPPEFWIAVVIGVFCALGVLSAWITLYVRWIFALPDCVVGGSRAKEALKRSARLVRGSFLRTAGVLAAWALGIAALGVASHFLLDLIEWVVLGSGDRKPGFVVASVALLVTLDLLAAAVVTFFGFTSHCLLVGHLYHEACRRSGEPSIDAAAEQAGPAQGETRPWLSTKRVAFTGAAVVLLGTAITSYFVVENANIQYSVAVTAHRGASKAAPENTISAVREAIRQGADFAEIDVQETKDGRVVMLHDKDLMRVAGLDKKIWEVTYDEIKDVDVGSWFSPEFRDERIAPLADVIREARGGKLKLNIELKFNGHDQRLAERVAEIVREEDFESQCVISSLEYEGLQTAKQSNDRLEIGFIVFRSVGDLTKLDVDFLSLNADHVTDALVSRVHGQGKEVHVWTVNDPDKMLEVIDLGVDNIITDEPGILVDLLQKRQDLSNAEKILLQFRVWKMR
ncbi:MAG: glycerophosphodiester phosphodiesterase family protein [Planctomycetota bacterium]|jgi:glycerophosphoryl diester phosphodiesterase